MIRVKQRTTRHLNLYVMAFYLVLLGTWQLLFSLGLVHQYLFPSPSEVVQRLWELGADGMLWPSIRATLWLLALGFSISAGLGLVIGLLMGVSPLINGCLKSLFLGLQTLPTAAWVPI